MNYKKDRNMNTQKTITPCILSPLVLRNRAAVIFVVLTLSAASDSCDVHQTCNDASGTDMQAHPCLGRAHRAHKWEIGVIEFCQRNSRQR